MKYRFPYPFGECTEPSYAAGASANGPRRRESSSTCGLRDRRRAAIIQHGSDMESGALARKSSRADDQIDRVTEASHEVAKLMRYRGFEEYVRDVASCFAHHDFIQGCPCENSGV